MAPTAEERLRADRKPAACGSGPGEHLLPGPIHARRRTVTDVAARLRDVAAALADADGPAEREAWARMVAECADLIDPPTVGEETTPTLEV